MAKKGMHVNALRRVAAKHIPQGPEQLDLFGRV